MPEYDRLRPRNGHERAFRALLRLYPRAFREDVGDAMVEFFRDRIGDARRTHGSLGALEAWGASLADLIRNAPLAYVDACRRVIRRATTPPLRAVTEARRKDRMLSSVRQDLRLALRGMRRAPAFSALVVTTLALGMGANVAIFSIVNGILFKPLPFADPERLVRISQADPYWTISEPEFADYRRGLHTLSSVSAYEIGSTSLTGNGLEAERVSRARVSDGFFEMLRVPALLGRTFHADEEMAGAPPVVVLSYGLWQRRYGGDRSIVGRDILINGRAYTVVGVMPPSFRFPREETSVWIPIGFRYDSLWERNNHYLEAIGRVAAGSSIGQVTAELRALTKNWRTDFPETYFPDKPFVVAATSLSQAIVGQARPYLLALLGAVGFVLLIACVNVANLLLVRGESRRKELAVRTALGASRLRLVRQGITESLLFSLAGGVAGVLIARLGVPALMVLAPAELPRATDVTIDTTVMAFAGGVIAFTALLFGVAPSWLAAREDTSETLKEGGKTSTSAARGAGRTRRRLVAAEIALTVVTLCGAGLMVRSLMRLQAVDLGFVTDHVLTMSITPAPATGLTRDQLNARAAMFFDRMLSHVRADPRVIAAAAVKDLPVADGNSMWSILIDGAPATTIAEAPVAMPQVVTSDYFAVMRIPLVKGRTFSADDRIDAPLVAIVNETMARKEWPGRDPLGRTIRMFGVGPDSAATVVGVVRDIRSAGYTGDIPPTMYFPHPQAGRSAYEVPGRMSLVIRTAGDPGAVTSAARRAVRDVDPNTPVSRVAPMASLVADSVGARRFSTLLLTAFGGLALLLAAIGIYGVISSTVAQRHYEIGVRLALGASRRDVMSMVLREGMRTAAIGAGFGVAGAIAAGTTLRAVFYEVTAWDPPALFGAVLLLLLAALAASWLPARRAGSVPPMTALRVD